MENVATVIGASRGLGFEISRGFAQGGAALILWSSIRASVEKSATIIKGNIYPSRLDATNAHFIAEFVFHIAERQSRIDILVNNAGYPFDRRIWNKKYHELAEEDFERVFDVDLKGTFRLLQAAISLMMKNGSNSRGGAVE